MRNFTQKLTALAAVGWLSLTTALAGEQFVPEGVFLQKCGNELTIHHQHPDDGLVHLPRRDGCHGKPRRSRGQGRIRIHGRKRSGPVQV